MKTILRVTFMILLVMAGVAVGVPIGQNRGFSTGSEWAIVQANILAREAGLFMPVNFEAGQFRIMMKQPKHLYKKAWRLADKREDEIEYVCNGDTTLYERIPLARNASLLR
jgi:hypothetical protein